MAISFARVISIVAERYSAGRALRIVIRMTAYGCSQLASDESALVCREDASRDLFHRIAYSKRSLPKQLFVGYGTQNARKRNDLCANYKDVWPIALVWPCKASSWSLPDEQKVSYVHVLYFTNLVKLSLNCWNAAFQWDQIRSREHFTTSSIVYNVYIEFSWVSESSWHIHAE